MGRNPSRGRSAGGCGTITRALACVLLLAGLARAGTFGQVKTLGGQAADLALDPGRGVLYVANFTANRVDVLSAIDGASRGTFHVAAHPGSLALSPDGQFLVVTHFGNFPPPLAPANALTVIGLAAHTQQVFALGNPPLGVAFGNDGLALIVTTGEFLLFDPLSGALRAFDTIAGVTATALPVPPPDFPPQVIAASVAASGDGAWIYGLTDTFRFRYDVLHKAIHVVGYTAVPALGPRVVSVSRDGSYFTAGWGLFDRAGRLLSQFPDPSGQLNIGSHAIDAQRGVIYAQVPQAQAASAGADASAAAPVLMLVDSDNLAVRQKLRLAENLAGKAVLSARGDMLYAISESGVTLLPVGSLAAQPRLGTAVSDLVYRGSFCDRRAATQEITVFDPGGGATDFTLTTTTPGVTISPAAGITPAVVRVTADPSAFAGQDGTVVAAIQLSSQAAVNVPDDIRVLINNRQPDQQGDFVNVAGQASDLLADPARDRFYVLLKDRNQVLVFPAWGAQPVATLRTANTPTQMTITFDNRYLLVGHENSQLLYVFNLDSLAAEVPVTLPAGHYPHSVAASGNAILAASRVAGTVHTIDRIDLPSRTAVTLPALGVFENNIDIHTVLTASPNGSSILVAMADGTVLLYSASADTFTAARKDFSSLAGDYAASSDGYFVVADHVLNAALVNVGQLAGGGASGLASSGFAFAGTSAFHALAPAATGAGILERVDVKSRAAVRPTRVVEAPLIGDASAPFTRTVAPLAGGTAIVALTVSGFTRLPSNYDAAFAPPRLDRVVNAADGSDQVAAGGLITAWGAQLAAAIASAAQMPVPAVLGGACLLVNGVPAPLLYASPTQINAQLPFASEGVATLVLRTPGGESNAVTATILPTAPSVFRNGRAGPDTGLATVVRASNNQLATLANPVHRGEAIVIYATGLGRTLPGLEAGMPAPVDPLLAALIQPELTLGGVALPIIYAGLTPGEVGVYQINAIVPRWTPTGMSVPLTITQGASSTQLSLRVVD